jgi:eukaryotic-like serine/threonine-protein kinase
MERSAFERPAFCFRFGSAEFDEARFELRVAGLPVEVERRALEVLAYLLRHAGEVVTKDELLREVWAGRVTVDKVLPNAINKLRRALGEANASHVTTQARVGYRLDGTVTRTAVGRQPASTLALAVGQAVPSRPNFLLLRPLGRTGGSEVWLAEHPKTREHRVYKFALDADRLRALKREVTLLRVLHEGLADASHVIEVLDWNFELSPYFIECRYGGVALGEWAAVHMPALDTTARISLFLQIAGAVAAAHAVGVLHKDLKPANVLVMGGAHDPHVRLTDFGSGTLLEPDRLTQLGITRLGMTVEDGSDLDSTSGTPLYVAPEQFAGQAPTVQSDVFALGILLYQLLTGRVGQPMASGWDSDIGDALLREDLRQATDGNPLRRLGSVAELAERLRRLDERRAENEQRQRAQQAAQRDREALARARVRRPYVAALVAVLAFGVVATTWLQQQAAQARNEAQIDLNRATALTRFLNEDLIGRSNPLVSAKGPDATLREVLLSARDRVPARFGTQPDAAAAIHGSLASLFSAVDLFQDAEAQARRALELLDPHGGAASAAAFQARAALARALVRRGSLADAQAQIDELERLGTSASIAAARPQIAAVRGALHIARNEFAAAVGQLRAGIEGWQSIDADNTASRDVMRVDLISALALAGEDRQAIDEGQRLIEEARSRPGDHELLVAMARLALVRAQGEDHVAAQKLLLDSQPVIVARLGENHSRHLSLLNELFGVAFRRADWPRALTYAQQVHERVRAKYGDDNVRTFVSMTNWARASSEAGRPREGVDRARTAHQQLVRLVGAKSPQAQDCAVVLALIELDLGQIERAQPLIEQLDVQVLESYRATGAWPAAIDALRGIALQRAGDAAAARPLLDSALAALKGEEDLSQPSRLYVAAKQARVRTRPR